MLELALHVLDLAENSVRAEASLVEITVAEDLIADTLSISIQDNGCGMNSEMLQKVQDPFFSTKKVRRIGLGLPLFKQAAELTGGSFSLSSKEGEGTRLLAVFGHSHIDRQPLGDMPGSIMALFMEAPEVDFIYRHRLNEREYIFDSRELRMELDGVPFSHPDVLKFIKQSIAEGLQELIG